MLETSRMEPGVKPMTDDELKRRYRELLRSPAIRKVGEERTSNQAKPVDEKALLGFVRETEPSHANFVHDVFKKHSLS